MYKPADLFQRELVVFVGKGGVGKTTTSAAVAMRLAREGRRTLLVTVDPAKRLKDALGVDVTHRLKEVRPKLFGMMLDPLKVIDEYLREKYPDTDVGAHPFYKYLSNYMPGINEVIAIGKLLEVRKEKHFDTIVVDTAPTGHALSFLTTPIKIRDLFRENQLLRWTIRGYKLYRVLSKSGRALGSILTGGKPLPPAPDIDFDDLFKKISGDVGSIQALLADHSKTTLIIVTLPEKLPIEETLELNTYVTKELGIRVGYIAVNKVQPDAIAGLRDEFTRLWEDKDAKRAAAEALASQGYTKSLFESLLQGAEFGEIRRSMNAAHIEDLEKRLPNVPHVLLPLHRRDIAGLDRLELLETEFFDSLARLEKTASKESKVVATTRRA